MGNLKRADDPLAEVEGLLKTLGEAWQAVAPGSSTGKDNIRAAISADYGVCFPLWKLSRVIVRIAGALVTRWKM